MNKSIPSAVLLCLLYAGALSQNIETVLQKGHELATVCVAVSPDSGYVATGSKDKSIKLWHVETGREVRSFLGHEKTVNNIVFSSDGRYLVSASYDQYAKIWEVQSGREIASIKTDDYLTDCSIDPNTRFFVVGGYNLYQGQDSAKVFDFKTQKLIAQIPINGDAGRGKGISMSVSPNGEYIAFGEDNRVVNIYETRNWTHVQKFEFSSEGWCGGCTSFSVFDPNSQFVFMVSHNGPFKKYDLTSGKLLKVFEDDVDYASGISVSPDGKLIARSTEKDVKIFDATSGTVVASRAAKGNADFHRIAFYGNNQLLITCDDNKTYNWTFEQDQVAVELTGFLNERDNGGLNYDPNFYWESAIAKYVRFKNSVLLGKDGKTLIKGKFGKKVKQWDIATGKSVMEFNGHKKAVLCYDLSKDGKKLLTGGGDGTIILWDMKTGDSLKVIRSYNEPIFDIHFNEDESKCLSSGWDATMKMHDLRTGERIWYHDFKSYAAYCLLFDREENYVITGRLDNSIELWETDTKTVVRNFVGHTDIISSLRLSAGNQTLLSASWDGTVRLWDIRSGLMLRKFKGHRGPVYAAIFSSDEKLIYSAGADRRIILSETSSGKVLRTFEGHQAEVTSLLLSADNKMLVSHSVDGVTKFWDLGSGKEFFEHIHIGETDWMVKNPEGYFNATSSARRYIHFVNGMQTYAVDQFFNDFYRPDLLPQIFQNRGASDQWKGIQGKLLSSPPPTIKLAIAPLSEGRAELFVRMIDNGSGVQELKIFHNGKSIPLTENLKYPLQKGNATTYKHIISLVGGANTFSAVARNRENIESDAATVDMFSEHATKSSVCHILAIGINAYKNEKLSLAYARPDAESFADVMQKKGSLFKEIELHTIFDGDATRSTILSKLDELARQIHPEDVFIFYYAGHGSMVDNQFYFIPFESSRLYDAASLNKEAIEEVILQEKFKHIKALKQVVIMDACQSGSSVELLATRGASEEKAIAQLSRSAGVHVMASAGSDQLATEFSELGHGLFTYVLIKALEGEADGAPKDGKVTIYELKSFMDDQVPEMTRKLKGKPQYPYTFSRGQDFPVTLEY